MNKIMMDVMDEDLNRLAIKTLQRVIMEEDLEGSLG